LTLRSGEWNHHFSSLADQRRELVNRMDSTAPPPLTIVQPGQGRAAEAGGIGVVFKLWGENTNGYVSVVEHPFAVGAFADPHLHTREDEYSIVTEGVIGFRSGDREVVLEAGGYITKPRGEVHAMWNAGRTPARMIEIISPAGLEKFFRDIADLVEGGRPPTLEEWAALAGNYGVQFENPPWWPDLMKRYNLTPSPGLEG
jgi:quercetin dioxygenase-like cupin family protein